MIWHFTWRLKYVFVLDSQTKYFVAGQQYRGNWLLHFCGNTEHLYCWDIYIYICQQQYKRNWLLHFYGNTEHLYCWEIYIYMSATIQKELVVAFLWQHWTLILLRYIYMSATIHKELVVAFLWQHWTLILLRYIYICQQQYKRNWLLHFYGNTEHLYCWELYMSATIQKNWSYFSMATMVMRLRHNVTLNALCLSCSFMRWDQVLPIHLPGRPGLGLHIKRNGKH